MDLADLDRDEVLDALDAREPQTVAATAVDLAAGLFQADAAALWWFLEDVGARLVARAPELPEGGIGADRSPPVPDSPSDDPVLVSRESASAAAAAFMDAHGFASAYLLPFRVDDLGRWLLTLGWCEPRSHEPRIEVRSLERFAARLEATLLRATERKMRDESHLELADNVAQALVVANTLQHLGDTEGAGRAIERALEHTKEVMSRLQRDNPAETFVRLYPSSVEVLDSDSDG